MAISPVPTRWFAPIAARDRGERLIAAVLSLGVGLLFWGPAARAGRGYFPIPLDDVYIHFDFARSLAQGHPFEWIPGQGYSSGETSPLYAAFLAIGWLIGFRGGALGIWAALLAVVSVASLLRCVRTLVRPCPPWLAWILALFPLSVGVVDWTLFSGMEVAVFAAVLARALVAVNEARSARARPTREQLHWRVGVWGAVLVLLRPEAGILVATFAIATAQRAGRRSGIAAVARVALPGAVATLLVLGANYVATGDFRSAGAQLKLLSSNPYLSEVDRARVFVENLVVFWVKVVRGSLVVRPALLAVLVMLWAIALVGRRHRGLAATCLVAAGGWILLVSWNANSPHHNFRYYVPALVLLQVAAALGIATVVRPGSRWTLRVASLTAFAMIAGGAPTLPPQMRHYRSAVANIRDQQVEVAERIGRLPDGSKVLLGDAGAIPYVSGKSAIDALGLGGYQKLPFARAALYGEAATVELLERLAPPARPTHFALYPNWFGTLTSRFGVEIDRVTIEDNVICGGTTKAIYRADWSALDVPHAAPPPNIVDEIDVGDVIDETEHAYAPPTPHGGWSTLDVLSDASGARRFDGGRIIPAGATESFIAKRSSGGQATVRVRVDGRARAILLRTSRATKELELEPPRDGGWRMGTAILDRLDVGDVVTLEARGGEYRDYHVWIERADSAAR